MGNSFPLALVSFSLLCHAGCGGAATPTTVTNSASASGVTTGPSGASGAQPANAARWRLESSGIAEPLVAIGGDAHDLWIAGSHSILHGDGLGSWRVAASNPDDEYRSLLVDGRDIYVAGMPCSGGVCQGGLLIRSSDGGQSWRRTLFTSAANGLAGDCHEVYLVLDSELRVASDDFATARALPMPVAHGLHAAGGALLVYGGLRSFEIRASSDGGNTWSSVYDGGGGSQSGHVDGMWGAGRTLFAVANGASVPASFGTLLRSVDGGRSWSTATMPTMERASSVWGSAGDDVYVLGSQLLHSRDGVTFSTVSLPAGAWQTVWGTAGGDLYVLGLDGAIAHARR